MEKADHRQTASLGRSNQQQILIEQGGFRKAQQMDIDDVKIKFGDKYDEGISKMLEYTGKLKVKYKEFAMHFDIKPYAGVGPIEFGMTSDEVESLLGKSIASFKRNKEDVFETEEFNVEENDLFIYYDDEKKVNAVEFALPAKIYFNGGSLYEKKFLQIKEIIKKQDKKTEDDIYSVTSYEFGIGVYCPDADEDKSAFPESVIVFKKGYYDNAS